MKTINTPTLRRWHYQQLAKKVAMMDFQEAIDVSAKLVGTNPGFDQQRFINACQSSHGQDKFPSRAKKTKFNGNQKQWVKEVLNLEV